MLIRQSEWVVRIVIDYLHTDPGSIHESKTHLVKYGLGNNARSQCTYGNSQTRLMPNWWSSYFTTHITTYAHSITFFRKPSACSLRESFTGSVPPTQVDISHSLRQKVVWLTVQTCLVRIYIHRVAVAKWRVSFWIWFLGDCYMCAVNICLHSNW